MNDPFARTPDASPRPKPSDYDMTVLRRSIFWRRLAVFLACVAVALALTVSTVGVVLIRTNQVTNGSALKIITDCTTPGRACYARSQRQTAGAVANINRVVIVATACAARQPGQTVAQVHSCVVRQLAKH